MNFPQTGSTKEELFGRMDTLKERDGNWRAGKTWSLVYYAGEEVTKVAEEAYLRYFHTNALNPSVFNSLRQFENEIISMVSDLLHGDENTAGSLTSGGSESILMAVKTYRDEARTLHPEITEPEMVLPISAHASFEKAAHYFGVKPVHIPLTGEYKADVEAAARAITKNTILMVGSAPAYPQGVVDPIEDLAKLALDHGIRFHVDACLGGFILPFVRDLGYDVPPFDFSIPGVTSISADLHKYGYAAKGASTVLYKNADIRRHQYFAYAGWPGGLFVSPSATGTRPGGAIAAAWAVLQYLGREGYLKLAGDVMQTTRQLIDGIDAIPGLYALGKPEASVFAVASDTVNVHALSDRLEALGWVIDQQTNPSCLHFMVTPAHREIAGLFLEDLQKAMEDLKNNPAPETEGSAAIYGMSGRVPQEQVEEYLAQTLSGWMQKE